MNSSRSPFRSLRFWALILMVVPLVTGACAGLANNQTFGGEPFPELPDLENPFPQSSPLPRRSQNNQDSGSNPNQTNGQAPQLPTAGPGVIPSTGENTTADQPPAPSAGPLADLFRQVSPGVVAIAVQVQQAGQVGEAAGSGFILTQDGYIATNHHVIEGASEVYVSFSDGTDAIAVVVGDDPASDLAVIKVEQLPEDAHPIPLGDSDQVVVGEEVVAIGNPFSVGTSMSSGIVSAVGRPIPSGFTQFNIPSAIQTDAAINPGNSGGPLINMRGEVIGINAQIRTNSGQGSGVGFAIPSNILRLIFPSMVENGNYVWPWLGVSGEDVTGSIQEANNLPDQRGAYIHEVVEGGPAQQAGLQGSRDVVNEGGFGVPVGGDVVIAVDGQPVPDFASMLKMVAFRQPGETLILTILRDGEQADVQVTLEPRPDGAFEPEPLLPPDHP